MMINFKKTKEALQKGYDLIHKAHFKYNGWVGEIDFLIKVQNKKTKNGKLSTRFSNCFYDYSKHCQEMNTKTKI